MTDKYLLSIDGGKSTGISLWAYSDAHPAQLIAGWQFPGGIQGFLEWAVNKFRDDTSFYGGMDLAKRNSKGRPDGRISVNHNMPWVIQPDELTVISERFIPLSGGGFSQTSDSVEPLRIEGALIALGLMPANYADNRWARPAAMYFCGGSTLAEKKKRSRAWLKETGNYLTGKQLNAPDNNDFVSSALHAMAYFRRIGHKPTIERYWPNESS